ncbi:MAG: GNAT family N-acetyltransferase [Cyanobacteriota bacterium]
MTSPLSENLKTVIRPVQYRDLEAIKVLATQSFETEDGGDIGAIAKRIQNLQRWYGLLKFLSLFPNPYQHNLSLFVAEQQQHLLGAIEVCPFNSSRSTWRVKRVFAQGSAFSTQMEVGSQLVRHCLERIWEARTWLLEVDVNHKSTLALYRQSGFQPLAQLTYWGIAPELLEELAQHEPDLPNLLPVSNADAPLLYQLDTVSMPPLLRQVFDRHIQDFKTNLISSLLSPIKHWFSHTEVITSYVFEPQRKAAIGYFELEVCHDGTQPHKAELTVHPAYTWLYPELLSKMAQIVQEMPPQALQLASADYQPEREEYLEQLGAKRIQHTLLMSRSVWHKLKEAKPVSLEGLQLSEVLQGLQPARTPIPSRMSWLHNKSNKSHSSKTHKDSHSASISPMVKQDEEKPSSDE